MAEQRPLQDTAAPEAAGAPVGSSPAAALGALRPTWTWAALVALAWGLRALAWSARAAFERPDVRVLHAAIGLAYDLLLVSALVWATRALARLVGPRLATALGAALGGISLCVRALDVGHCFLVQCHWAPEAFLYLEWSYVDAVLQPRFLPALLGAAAVLALLPWGLWRDLRRDLRRVAASPGARRRAWLVPAAASLIALALPVYDATSAPEDVFNPRLIPELNFAVQWRAWQGSSDRVERVTPLPEATARRLRQAGVLHGESALAGFPLVRRGLGEPALAAKPGAEPRPNVVLALIESLDALFIHELSGHYRGLMPHLDEAARKHTVVAPFYNTASPTISALAALLCSVNPPTHPRDMAPGAKGEVLAAHTCLSDLLRHAGYRTVFVMGSPSSMTRTGDFLLHHGFDEIHDRANFEARYPGRPIGQWGAHDDAMVDYVTELIERLEKQRQQDGRPYLLLFMTIDTHEPGMAHESCQLPDGASITDVPEDPAARRLLAAYHCTDRELGRLIRFLDQPARASSTLWLLTGDHVAFRTATSRPLLAGMRKGWSFGLMPLLLHDPRHDLPRRVDVLSGSLDFAPTALHLLGLEVGLHSMTGRSAFGTRRQHPFLLGRLGGRLAFARNAESSHEASRESLETICEGQTLLLPKGPNLLNACDVLAWMRWQDQLWSARRLFPRTVYWGEARD